MHSSASRTTLTNTLDFVKHPPPARCLSSPFHRWMKLSYPFPPSPFPLQSRKIQRNSNVFQCVEESYGSVDRSRLSLTRFPSRALTLGGREEVKKKLLVINCQPSLTCLDAISIYRTTLVLPCFFPPSSTVAQSLPWLFRVEYSSRNSTLLSPPPSNKTHEPILYHYSPTNLF